MTSRFLYRLGFGVGVLSLALSSMGGGCKGKDCADERIGQKRCVGNRLETCGPNNELTYDSCTDNEGPNKYCSAAHKACVTKDIFDAQTVGSTASTGEGGSMMHGSGGMHAGAGGDMTVAMSSADVASSSAMSSAEMASTAMSSSAATGGGDLMTPINGCDPNTLKDETANPLPVIIFSGLTYMPACIKIKVGQSVLFVGSGTDFVTHPLYGGLIDSTNVKTVDSIGPIKPTTTGNSVSVAFTSQGAYGFFCDFHYAAGMKGAVYVVP
jgi:plastocyanin